MKTKLSLCFLILVVNLTIAQTIDIKTHRENWPQLDTRH